MTALKWDEIGSRQFEAGVDRGVLYLADGTGVVWNGLVSVAEKTSVTIEPLYFDGRKFNDSVTLSDYSATITAFTYPDEFFEYEGLVDIGNGFGLFDQRLARFGISYRTKIGDDLVALTKGYKIHVVYNLIATPGDISHESLSDSPDAIQFQWDVTAVPVRVPGFEPTAHFVLDTIKSPAGLKAAIEGHLYGSSTVDANLPPLSYFLNLASMDW
jgi:hypothetical protein